MNRSRTLVLAFALAAASAGALGSLPSCSDLPEGTCYGDQVNALEAGSGADGSSPSACSDCLQQHCCDLVGACDNQKGCPAEIKSAQACVIDAAAKESVCQEQLDATSQALYGCMRKPCGTKCSVPSCDLDPAVVLFANPSCDRCIVGNCCTQVNECYANRGCKLVLECITKHCPNTLGPSMSVLGMAPPEGIMKAIDDVCAGNPSPLGRGAGACLQRCLDEFTASGEDDSESKKARCLAFKVDACGALHSCGNACTPDPDGGDLSLPWDEDRIDDGGTPSDAGRD